MPEPSEEADGAQGDDTASRFSRFPLTMKVGCQVQRGVEGTHNSYSVPIHHIYNFAALLILMRRTTPFEPIEPIEPVEPMR